MTDFRDERPVTSSTESDAYAATYMKGAGRVVLRDKAVGRTLLVILGLATLWCGGGAVLAFLGLGLKASIGAAMFLSLLTTLFAFLTATMTVVRTVVSAAEVHVQFGLWGPRVPVGRIRRCRVTPYDWMKFGGWGIRRSGDGVWAYVLKSGGDVVEFTWTDDAGAEKTAQFSASDPRAVVAAIEEARAAAAGASTAIDEAGRQGARIADDEAHEADEADEEQIDIEAKRRRS